MAKEIYRGIGLFSAHSYRKTRIYHDHGREVWPQAGMGAGTVESLLNFKQETERVNLA